MVLIQSRGGPVAAIARIRSEGSMEIGDVVEAAVEVEIVAVTEDFYTGKFKTHEQLKKLKARWQRDSIP